MGREKTVNYYNGMYLGSLSEKSAKVLETLMGIDAVDDLRHCIYDLPESAIYDIKDSVENYGVEADIEKPIGTLRDYQTVGSAFMYYAGNVLCGDSVGLGKTTQIAALVNVLKSEKEKQGSKFRFLFLGEKGSIGQIRDKLIRFTGEYIAPLSGVEKDVTNFLQNNPTHAVYSVCGTHSLIKQPQFVQWMIRNNAFDLLVIDESYIFKTSTSEITVLGREIVRSHKRVIFLNATPFETKLSDFYTQLDLLDPLLLPSKSNFEKEYCRKDFRGFIPKTIGYKNEDKFRKLISLRYFARTRKDLGATIEDNEATIMFVPLSKEQKELMSKTQLWRMVTDCPSALMSGIEFNDKTVPKVSVLEKILKEDVVAGDKVLVYSHYKEAQALTKDYLQSKGFSCAVLNGESNQKQRDSILYNFNNGGIQILITNIQRGLDLEDCNTCIFYSFDPNPQKMVQTEGRITREFDIIGKRIFVICAEGKEKKFIESKVKLRAKAGTQLAVTDKSSILELLSGGN